MESTPGKRMQQWREFKGITITALSQATGINVTTISQAENPKGKVSNPSYDTLTKMLVAYPDLNPDWLLLGTGPMLRDGRTLTPATPKDTEKPEAAAVAEPVLKAIRGGLPTPGEATPQQADFVGRLIKRLEDELDASKGRELYWQERAERLEKPSPTPDATWLPLPAATPISLRPAACATTEAKAGGKVVAMWPVHVAVARAQA